jgi:hypothetical protein
VKRASNQFSSMVPDCTHSAYRICHRMTQLKAVVVVETAQPFPVPSHSQPTDNRLLISMVVGTRRTCLYCLSETKSYELTSDYSCKLRALLSKIRARYLCTIHCEERCILHVERLLNIVGIISQCCIYNHVFSPNRVEVLSYIAMCEYIAWRIYRLEELKPIHVQEIVL